MFTYFVQTISKLYNWFITPQTSDLIDRENFINVQLDAIGVGIASAALPFVPVLITRLGANNFQVGLLTTIPALTGLFLSIPLGEFLQRKTNLIPWYSVTRALALSRFAIIGLISIFLQPKPAILIILIIWTVFTIPQTILSTLFSLVMNLVAGPKGRFELMSRRWSLLGITTAITIFIAGQLLDKIIFPLNYQVVFLACSIGGVLSYQFSRRLKVVQPASPGISKGLKLKQKLSTYVGLVSSEKRFVAFATKRFIFMIGTAMAVPLFPLYFVNVIKAPDSWIALFSTSQTAITFIGYFFWLKYSRKKGARFVLVSTTLCLSFYPMIIALLGKFWIIAILAGLQGLFESGLNLVFFDELMKTIPKNFTTTFISLAQSIQFLASTIAPSVGALLAKNFDISTALIIAGCVQFFGFLLFLFHKILDEDTN